MSGVSFALLVSCAFFIGCYSSRKKDEEIPVTTDSCGDIKKAVFPIINGNDYPDPEVVRLTESQIAAIGGVTSDAALFETHCTGTLIAPDVVLTAAHCISQYTTSMTFSGGRNISPERREFAFAATGWHVHPGYPGYVSAYDVALLVLAGDTLAQGITPIPVNCERLTLTGETVQAVGYGLTDPSERLNTIRYWTTLQVESEGPGWYVARAEGTGTCYGDSGGPILYMKDDGEVRVYGVASGIERRDCLGYTFYASTDFSCEFIREFLSDDPCWGETIQGRCVGSKSIRCDGGEVVVEDCAPAGFVCGDDENGYFRCLPPPDPCEGETYEGRCDGNRAVWCDGEGVVSLICYRGTICGNLGDGLYRCVDECDLIGMTGRCDEGRNVARWCEGGEIKERDCGLCGQECRLVGEDLGFYCE